MENIKVRVAINTVEEALDLLVELGINLALAKNKLIVEVENGTVAVVVLDGNAFTTHSPNVYNCKELTIPRLRDKVVLKRNDVGDATHSVDGLNGSAINLSGKWYAFNFNIREWELWADCFEYRLDDLKPIKEKEMKEFLVNHDNKWTLQLLDADTEENSFRVAVPSGADIYWQEDGEYWFTTELMGYRDAEIVWQRYTQPEELPFIDDEPKSLNDTYAEIEQVRQDAINNPTHYTNGNIECLDAMQAMLSPDEFIGFLRGNIFKYQWRYKLKNGVEDLKKAQFYQNKLIELESKG